MLTSYINELLYTHNCVIVPDFGGFITQKTPSAFYLKSQTLYPQRNYVAFNSQLNSHDGLLANHIAKHNNVSYNQALSYISTCVSKWKQELENEGNLELNKLGTLSNVSGILEFRADRNANYLTESYGLSPIHAFPVNTTKSKKVEKQFEDRPAIQNKAKQTKRITWKTFASLGVAGIVIWSAVNPDKLENLYLQYGSFDFFSKKPIEVVSTPAPTISLAPISKQYSDTEVADASELYTGEKRYYVIAGCFQDITLAKQLVRELKEKGYTEASLAGERKGLHVVAYTSFPEKNKAMAVLAAVKYENPGAWMHKQ